MKYSGRRLGLSTPAIVQSSAGPEVRDTVGSSQMLEEREKQEGREGGADSLGQVCGLLPVSACGHLT